LPVYFLTDVGRLVQLCAHIEQVCCALIAVAEAGTDPDDPAWFSSFIKARKSPLQKMRKRLRQSAAKEEFSKHDDALSSVLFFLEKVHTFRNAFVHGACVASPDGTIQTDYVFTEGAGADRLEARQSEKITQAHMRQLLQTANALHELTLGVLDCVDDGLAMRCMRRIYPLLP